MGTHGAVSEARERSEAARAASRRFVLLGAAIIAPTLLVALGITAAWPLYALPLARALPLAGPRGMAAALAAAGITTALVTGRAGTDGLTIAIGLASFCAAGLAVGLGHHNHLREAERIAGISLTDRLTGVHNYAFFEDALPRECRRAERYGMSLSLVILDLDRFKAFNDRHGHDAGNRLLAAVGDAIRATSRTTDVAARFGGEEFALIVPGPADEAVAAAERIREAVARIAVLVAGGESTGITISAGVAEFDHARPDTGARMLDQADKALYHSKASGRDRVSLFSPEHRWAAAG
jgi:diguanylate cyclase (GGDEF)-like protein